MSESGLLLSICASGQVQVTWAIRCAASITVLLAACNLDGPLPVSAGETVERFPGQTLSVPARDAFSMKDYWIWGGSVVCGEDGKYHMFASRWPRDLPMSPHWLTNSEVVHAVADSAEGPYEFVDVVLPRRGTEFWDGGSAYNPTVLRVGVFYALYYTGTRYSGTTPTSANPLTPDSPQAVEALGNQTIGLAIARTINGPWVRSEKPILTTRKGRWDGFLVTNPAVSLLGDGRLLLIYKARGQRGGRMRLGVAAAQQLEGPYERLTDEPIPPFGEYEVEDPYIWQQQGTFFMIMKDQNGEITGEVGAGACAESLDGVSWRFCNVRKSFSRTIPWEDGRIATQGRLERPQLLIQNGVPTHLFLATADGARREQIHRTWNVVLPLADRHPDSNACWIPLDDRARNGGE